MPYYRSYGRSSGGFTTSSYIDRLVSNAWNKLKAGEFPGEVMHDFTGDYVRSEIKKYIPEEILNDINDDGEFNTRGIYGKIKNGLDADPDNKYLKLMARIWGAQFKDGLPNKFRLAKIANNSRGEVDNGLEQVNKEMLDAIVEKVNKYLNTVDTTTLFAELNNSIATLYADRKTRKELFDEFEKLGVDTAWGSYVRNDFNDDSYKNVPVFDTVSMTDPELRNYAYTNYNDLRNLDSSVHYRASLVCTASNTGVNKKADVFFNIYSGKLAIYDGDTDTVLASNTIVDNVKNTVIASDIDDAELLKTVVAGVKSIVNELASDLKFSAGQVSLGKANLEQAKVIAADISKIRADLKTAAATNNKLSTESTKKLVKLMTDGRAKASREFDSWSNIHDGSDGAAYAYEIDETARRIENIIHGYNIFANTGDSVEGDNENIRASQIKKMIQSAEKISLFKVEDSVNPAPQANDFSDALLDEYK